MRPPASPPGSDTRGDQRPAGNRGPLGRWLDRHLHPVNFWIHMLGIPLTIAAIPLAAGGYWVWAIILFVAGYALQFLGHTIEGNRSGEELLLRRLLRRGERPGN